MPVINLINYPFANGTTPTGTEISEVFYLPAAVPVSLEGINGWLDKQNADASFTEITYDQVQENSFHYADTAAGTASLDYLRIGGMRSDLVSTHLKGSPLPSLLII